MKTQLLVFAISLFLLISCEEDTIDNTNMPNTNATEILYTMPDESELHEGTWLYWPHEYQFGKTYRNRLDATWVAMTDVLKDSEKVHLVAYNEAEKDRISALLKQANISLANIDLNIYKTDDVWARDAGPIYVKDKNGELVIQDWGFNGWGNKFKYSNCNTVPAQIGANQNKKVVDLNQVLINEGGAIEIDGNGTLMATKSSILNSNRNPGKTQAQAEEIFTKYLGVTNFIWLDGVPGLEITDMHIDGFAKFANKNILVTMAQNDLLDWQVPQKDIDKLFAAKDKSGNAYTLLKLPLTKNNVITEFGKKLGYKGSYINYYIANTVILVPNYNDENDKIANEMIQKLYPNRKVVGIDVRNLYENGGMVHCITQQQPK